jgi:hypothetical protein
MFYVFARSTINNVTVPLIQTRLARYRALSRYRASSLTGVVVLFVQFLAVSV